jgi:hypothetical protein
MRQHRVVTAPLLTLLVAALAMQPAPARAAGHLAARVDGSFGNGAGAGTFEGTLMLSGFERRGDRLVAVGTLDGTLSDAAGKQLGEIEDRAVAAVVELGSLTASCERATLKVRLDDVDAGGVRVQPQPVEIEIPVTAVPGQRLRDPLCELGKAATPSADLGALAKQLDGVLAALE